jgi:hypothetical protein
LYLHKAILKDNKDYKRIENMPPKGKSVVEEKKEETLPRSGTSKFIYIELGLKTEPIKFMSNSNCRLDIALDFAKTFFIKTLTAKITELKFAVSVEQQEKERQHFQSGEAKDETPFSSETSEKLESFITIQQKLLAVLSVNQFELADSAGAFLNVPTLLSKEMSETIPLYNTYQLGIIEQDKEVNLLMI